MKSSGGVGKLSVLAAGALSLALPVFALGQVAPRIESQVDDAHLVTLPGNTHPLAQPQYDQGPVSTSGRMLLTFKRTEQQEAELQQLLREQKDRSSPNYHKWLSPAEFGKRFGIADADLQTVSNYLQQKGFTVGKLTNGRMSLELTGTAAQVRDTFHTEIHHYSVAGKQFNANDRDPQIPAALAPVVAGFASLNNYKPFSPDTSTPPTQVAFDGETHTVKPLFTTTTTVNGQSIYHFGVSPGDLAKIYNIPTEPKLSGVVPSIGVISDSNVDLFNIAKYGSLFALPGTGAANGTATPTIVVDGDDPGITSDALTTTEELELIYAVAPYATVNLYTSATTDYDTGLDFASIRAVEDGTVNIILFGFAICESQMSAAGNQFAAAIWEQAAAEGITVISAAGDSGAAGCDVPGASTGTEAATGGLAVSGFASTPYDTAVGGTDFYYSSSSADLNYWNTTNSGSPAFTSAIGPIPQQPWNDSVETTDQLQISPEPLYGGGGGVSTLGYINGSGTASGYALPSWQTSAVGSKSTTRVVPDVALFAGDQLNLSNYILCFLPTDCGSGVSSKFTSVGGTAGASAVFAGIVAQLVQKYSAQGNINPELYALGASTTANAFYDVTVGGNQVNTSSGTIGYNAATGFDFASGWGAVNATNLIANWANINSGSSPSIFTLQVYNASEQALSSGASVVHGTTTTFGAILAAAGGKATPTGDVSILSTNIQAGNKAIDRMTLSVSGTLASTNDAPGGVQLPGGTYNLYAYYPGNSVYAPATTSTFTITVTPESSEVLIMSASDAAVTSSSYVTNLNFNLMGNPTVPYGSQVRVTVEAFGSTDLATSVGYPSGYITVLDNGTAIAYLPIDSEGAATFESSNLALGSHSLTFSYGGDSSYNASTSLLSSTNQSVYNNLTGSTQTALTFTVAAAPTTTTLTASNTDVTEAGSNGILFTAVVASQGANNVGAAPSGNVVFNHVNTQNQTTSQTTVATTPAYDSNGNLVAIATYYGTTAGGYQAFFQSSNSDYSSSTSNLISNITQSTCSGSTCTSTDSTTTISIVGGATSFASDASLVIDVSVTAIARTAGQGNTGTTTSQVSGTVTFYANGVQIGSPVTLNSGNGTATFTVPKTGSFLDLPGGTVVLTAEYNGGTATIQTSGNPYSIAANASFAAPLSISINGNEQGSASTPSTSGDFGLTPMQTAQVMTTASASAAFPIFFAANSAYMANYASTGVSVACYTPTAGLTCTLSSSGITFNSSGYAQVTATITPTSGYTLAIVRSPAPPAAHPRWWVETGGVALGCVILFGIPARRRAWQGLLGVLFLCVVVSGLSGCAGNSLNSSESNTSRSVSSGTFATTGNGFTSVGGGTTTTNGTGVTPAANSTVAIGTYPVLIFAYTSLNGQTVSHDTAVNVVVQ